MAAANPAAVAMSASEIPGATTARVADPRIPIPRKASMIPHTVPKRPMKGVVEPVVARNPRALSILVCCEVRACRMARLIFSLPLSSRLKEVGSLLFREASGVLLA
jgi:hypothetical protein